MLALFGAPVLGTDDAERAVACAIAMQQSMDHVNRRNLEDGLPLIEMGIALSIIYAAVIALTGQRTRVTLAVTSAIGLLHGLGFSFVLHEILRLDSPNLWQSLLSFNLGVEIGQIGIVVLVWPVFWLLMRAGDRPLRVGRYVIALPAAMVAAMWTEERLLALISNL